MQLGKLWLRMTIILSVCGFGALALSAQAAGKDEILLKDGSRILGTVSSSRAGEVIIETDFAGTLTIPMEKVDSLRTVEPVVVLLEDDTVLRDGTLVIEENAVTLAGPTSPAAQYPLEALQIVNPQPWELGEGYRRTGLVSFALAMQRGNTDTDELDYNLESVWRSTRDRYTFQGMGETDEANGEKNADNWQFTGKYDYFLTDPNYVGLLAFVEKDKFADLDLRYLVGPYLGRAFFEEPVFTLSGEVGVSYVTEEFNIAEDQDYPAGNWSLNATSNYLGGDSRLYANQIGIWNFEETSDVIVNTTVGLAFPLLWSLEAAAEMLWEYDSGAPDDIDEMDQTYRVRIGYTW